mmetsp:Transcript_28759/g.61331  ORF Transcript_28759/g.61331 Transcript_28759/m.61331 type:complete len:225 (-) Transcript_28759:146-820(-)|eukprot:CAMPEP_0172299414 /NCGR_PEP_ID=MMETSP1058-20130122/1737_1 /TAXON_ID=83371 /ORGANISM="Detonula confervacea, Strain CCMP 353" /LENGTH=224 /DNA_ID=CAMNT_0013008861 /DNA_START=209 /DNA_END=883 /DNA_ORIENTATION=-
MEEPPKIERIVSSKGISLSDTATILKAYLSNIDQHHHEVPPLDKDNEDEQDATTSNEDNDKNKTPRKSRHDWEEEALIAQMDALVNNKSSSGMMSDDVYERLKMITKSICAEVDGVPLSASGMTAAAAAASEKSSDTDKQQSTEVKVEVEEQIDDNGAFDFLAELEEAERVEQQQHQVGESKRDKKKEKKAKKSAKKAKKDAKRKAKEMEGDDGAVLKKAKVES